MKDHIKQMRESADKLEKTASASSYSDKPREICEETQAAIGVMRASALFAEASENFAEWVEHYQTAVNNQ